MKIVIIDDERLAREELRSLVEDLPDARVVGEAGDAADGVQVVQALQPDLIFLDISMPEQSGFDFLQMLPAPHPRIIFVTAYDAFALRAFEVNAVDYLMKPVVPERLAEAYERARQVNRAPDSAPPPDTPSPLTAADRLPLREDDQVLLREDDKCYFVPLRRIRLLEGEDNHTRVWFDDQNLMLYRTLVSMEERLPTSMFLRANRAQLVNRHVIAKVEPWFSGTIKATLQDGTEIEFSRRQSKLFRERMGL
ncbi:LytR/AlgR family response regulator transcription factor [Actomonas aquatica]|uniref:LytTR family DNA-binding domain-containing protein n=1 Tax=Actomonas aquatica TaxID=2866162 RepID=A0ABZ1CGS6_9BACT|nr:LytTR family DNA-binding domain-containing protein [Opitutus sp. WL0086]WRQ89475.1 LytTR family DNA-binding domain-containing protein [Opitutus sp. WL0086]